MKNHSLKFIAKLLISIILVIILIIRIDYILIIRALISTRLEVYFLSFLLFLLQQVLSFYSWALLIRTKYSELSFREIAQAYLIGSFYGPFLPTSIGIDFSRALSLAKRVSKRGDAVGSMFVCRISSLFSLLLLASIATVQLKVVNDHGHLQWLVIGVFISFILGFYSILNSTFRRIIGYGFDKIGAKRMKDEIKSASQSFRNFLINKKALVLNMFLSFLSQIIGIYFVYVAGLSLNIEIPLMAYYIYVPIIQLITLIPISLGGIGVREGGFVYFFSEAGASQAQSLSLSFLLLFQMLSMTIAGGIFYIMREMRQRKIYT